MLLVPTTTTFYLLITNPTDDDDGEPQYGGSPVTQEVTFDADLVAVYLKKDDNKTELLFGDGVRFHIDYPYDELMRFLAEQGDETHD